MSILKFNIWVPLKSVILKEHWTLLFFTNMVFSPTSGEKLFGSTFSAIYILLKGTNIHFSKSILPVNPFGHIASGQYTLSSDQKSIIATVGGECASIYFGQEKSNGVVSAVTHEVPIWFDNIGKTSFQSKLIKSHNL